MNKHAVYHRIESEYVYPLTENKIVIVLRTAKNDCDYVEMVSIDKYKFLFWKEEISFTNRMTKILSDDLFDYFEIETDYNMNSMGYFFKIISGNEVLYYGNYGFYEKIEMSKDICYLDNMFTLSLVDKKDIFHVPEWAETSIVYQIFPERFYRGDNYIPSSSHDDWHGEVTYKSTLGGNLQGIMDKLDYLSDLGINTIYLNPIFHAMGNHKYVTTDYYTIDPDFGTNQLFKDFVKKSHEKGIRIILDGAFASTGVDFFAFKDVLEKQEKSQYKDWFKIESFPINTTHPVTYKAFAYAPFLPKVNYSNKDAGEYFLKVMEYWITEYDIDGWRLDCANEVPHTYWQEVRQHIKSIKSDALLIGEIWYDSRSWLSGNELDTVMNYMFFTPVLDFIAKETIKPSVFIDKLQFSRAIYKKQTHKLLWNLIGSHDTSRFLHESNGNTDKLKLASLIQFTVTGTPCIYYGDEAGMTGANDPHCRMGMIWDEEKRNRDLHSWYKKLISIRKNKKSLIYGSFSAIIIDDDKNFLGYKREYENEEIYVYINNDNSFCEIELPFKMLNLLDNSVVCDKLNIPPKSAVILEKVI